MRRRESEIEISFRDERLWRLCSKDREGQRVWGSAWAILKRRLALLVAAEVLSDIAAAPGGCRELAPGRGGQFAIEVTARHRLRFEVSNNPLPITADGRVDQTLVTAIRILEIEEYRGD